MIIFAAITPHSPLLLESVNKERRNEVKKTIQAIENLSDDLYALQPDTVVVFSSHAKMFDNTFSISMHSSYEVDLSEFGDLTSKQVFKPDLMLIDRIQRSMRAKSQPLTLTADEKLYHGTAVPLLLLTKNLPGIKVVPISHSGLSAKEHFTFGAELKDTLVNSNKRIAVIASGDQSHCLTTNSPGGFKKEGKQYDDRVQEFLMNSNTSGLLQMDKKILENANECSYLSLLMLLGVIDKLNTQAVIESYEAPFGVGYLTVSFKLT